MKARRAKVAIATAGLLTIMGLLIAVALPYRPVVVAGPRVEPVALSLSEALPGLRLHVFNTGSNRMSSLLVGEDPPWRPVPAFVIEHPSRGLIAFDLGLSREVAEYGEDAIPAPLGWLMESRGRPGLTLESQMQEAGLSARDVGHVVISHLHGDHTGDAVEFEDAVFLAGPGTRTRVIDGPDSLFDSDAKPDWRELEFAQKGHPLGPFDAAIDLFGDGSIHLIAGAGHTAEDVMMLVNLESGAVLLTGDTVVHYDWLESDDVERIAVDPDRAAVSRNRVRSVLDSGDVLIIPGHDLSRLGTGRPDMILHHPERFQSDFWPTVLCSDKEMGTTG